FLRTSIREAMPELSIYRTPIMLSASLEVVGTVSNNVVRKARELPRSTAPSRSTIVALATTRTEIVRVRVPMRSWRLSAKPRKRQRQKVENKAGLPQRENLLWFRDV